ncbi:hypothetical protein Ancab_021087 [Ancistrocladus abbreviatus]
MLPQLMRSLFSSFVFSFGVGNNSALWCPGITNFGECFRWSISGMLDYSSGGGMMSNTMGNFVVRDYFKIPKLCPCWIGCSMNIFLLLLSHVHVDHGNSTWFLLI